MSCKVIEIRNAHGYPVMVPEKQAKPRKPKRWGFTSRALFVLFAAWTVAVYGFCALGIYGLVSRLWK